MWVDGMYVCMYICMYVCLWTEEREERDIAWVDGGYRWIKG